MVVIYRIMHTVEICFLPFVPFRLFVVKTPSHKNYLYVPTACAWFGFYGKSHAILLGIVVKHFPLLSIKLALSTCASKAAYFANALDLRIDSLALIAKIEPWSGP
jgi:hypothetical protein